MSKSLIIPRDENGAAYPATREELAAKLTLDAAGAVSVALEGPPRAGQPGLIGLFCDVEAWYEHFDPAGATPDPAVTGVPLSPEALKYATTPAGWKIAVKRRGADDGIFTIHYCR